MPNVKIEIYPRAEADIVHQFRYYLVEQDAPRRRFDFVTPSERALTSLSPTRA
jgi:hypothetical protein